MVDCNITATAEPQYEQNNNGSTALGFAVVSTDNSMSPAVAAPEAKIGINGGRYTGLVGLGQIDEFKDNPDFKEASYAVSGGIFSSDVTDYVADAKEVSVQKGGTVLYAIGDDSIAEAVKDAKEGDVVTVLKGEGVTGIPDGVTVKNETGGNITVNGVAVPAGKEAVAHKAEKVGAKEPTCTEPGNIDYWYCADCGKYFADEALTTEIDKAKTVVAAAGHNHATKVEAKAATATEPGNINYWYCADCGRYFSDEALTKEIAQADTVIAATGPIDDKPTVTKPTGDKPADTTDNSGAAVAKPVALAKTGDIAEGVMAAFAALAVAMLGVAVCARLRMRAHAQSKNNRM